MLGLPYVSSSLDAVLPEELKALRGFDDFSLEGVLGLAGLLDAYANSLDNYSKEEFSQLADRLKAACVQEQDDGIQLMMALIDTDDLFRRTLEKKEVSLLNDPELAEAFLEEVFITNTVDARPISKDELVEFRRFSGLDRTEIDQKVTWSAQFIYYLRGNHSTLGLTMAFENPNDWLDGRRPRDIIQEGNAVEVTELLRRTSASRYQTTA